MPAVRSILPLLLLALLVSCGATDAEGTEKRRRLSQDEDKTSSPAAAAAPVTPRATQGAGSSDSGSNGGGGLQLSNHTSFPTSSTSAPRKRPRKGPKPRIRLVKVYKKVWRKRKPKRKTTPTPSSSPPKASPVPAASSMQTNAEESERIVSLATTTAIHVTRPDDRNSSNGEGESHKANISINASSDSTATGILNDKDMNDRDYAASEQTQQNFTESPSENSQTKPTQSLGNSGGEMLTTETHVEDTDHSEDKKKTDLSPLDSTTEENSYVTHTTPSQNTQEHTMIPIEETIPRFYNADVYEQNIKQASENRSRYPIPMVEDKLNFETKNSTLEKDREGDSDTTRFLYATSPPSESSHLLENVRNNHSLVADRIALGQTETENNVTEPVSVEPKKIEKLQHRQLDETDNYRGTNTLKESTTPTGDQNRKYANNAETSETDVSSVKREQSKHQENISTLLQNLQENNSPRNIHDGADKSQNTTQMKTELAYLNNTDSFRSLTNIHINRSDSESPLDSEDNVKKMSTKLPQHLYDTDIKSNASKKVNQSTIFPAEGMKYMMNTTTASTVQNASQYREHALPDEIISERFLGNTSYEKSVPQPLQPSYTSKDVSHFEHKSARIYSKSAAESLGAHTPDSTIGYARAMPNSNILLNPKLLDKTPHTSCLHQPPEHQFSQKMTSYETENEGIHSPDVSEIRERVKNQKWYPLERNYHVGKQRYQYSDEPLYSSGRKFIDDNSKIFENSLPYSKENQLPPFNQYSAIYPTMPRSDRNDLLQFTPETKVNIFIKSLFPPIAVFVCGILFPCSSHNYYFVTPSSQSETSDIRGQYASSHSRALTSAPSRQSTTHFRSPPFPDLPFAEDGVFDSEYENLIEEIENRPPPVTDFDDDDDDYPQPADEIPASGRRMWTPSKGKIHSRKGVGLSEGTRLFLGQPVLRRALEASSSGWSPPRPSAASPWGRPTVRWRQRTSPWRALLSSLQAPIPYEQDFRQSDSFERVPPWNSVLSSRKYPALFKTGNVNSALIRDASQFTPSVPPIPQDTAYDDGGRLQKPSLIASRDHWINSAALSAGGTAGVGNLCAEAMGQWYRRTRPQPDAWNTFPYGDDVTWPT